MTAGTDTFGDIAELATALGVLGSDGSISTDFFVDPATTMGGMLRDGTRREALLKFLDDVLGGAAPQVEESTATWTPIFKLSADVHLYLVTNQLADGISLGIGVRGATSGTPHAEGRLSLPLVLIPPSGPAVFLPGSNSLDAVAELAAEVDVGSPNLQSVGLTAAIPVGPNASGDLTVTVTGLRVPGSDTPLNLSLDSLLATSLQLLRRSSSSLVERPSCRPRPPISGPRPRPCSACSASRPTLWCRCRSRTSRYAAWLPCATGSANSRTRTLPCRPGSAT